MRKQDINTGDCKTLKMIGTKDFIIELLESPDGIFAVTIETKEVKDISVPVRDLSVAFTVFDSLYKSFSEKN